MLSMGIWQLPLTVIPTLLGSYFRVLGYLWSQKWCHFVMVEADSHLKLLPASISYAVHVHMAVASNSYTPTTWVRFWGFGSLVESKWCVMSWLRLTATSNCFLHPCLSTLICCLGAYGSSLKQLYPHYLGQIWGSGSLVESKWYDYVMVEAGSQLRLLPASTSYIHKVFEHIHMLSMGIWQ